MDRLGPWKDLVDVTKNTMEWVAWYNSERLHSYCKNAPPFEYEEAFYETHAMAG
ncbi:MAG: integrase core domain-containing protein [Streptomycetales bacterium]